MAPPRLLRDVAAHLRDESHRSSKTTFAAMRRAYVASRGRTKEAVASLFRAVRPTPDLPDVFGVAESVRDFGWAARPGALQRHVVDDIVDHLSGCPGNLVGAGFAQTPMASIEHVRSGVKFDYASNVVLEAPHVGDLISRDDIVGAAAHCLRAEPIFAGVHAWWSLADPSASDDVLSGAAQLYHFDYDYPAFVKLFFYLTDVDEGSGPFAFIEGSHRAKPVWRDGRFGDQELLRDHSLEGRERRLTGEAGTLLVVDTSGFHKGTPVASGRRLILQLEFAVSRLGGSSQYDLYPAALRPASSLRHTFDAFAG